MSVTPSIEVDALTYYLAVGGALFMLMLWGLWFFYKISRNSELKLKMARINWIYDFFTSKTGAIRKIIIPETVISDDRGFKIGNERYFAVDKDNKGQITVFSHRGKRAYYHSAGHSMPHAITDHSLDSTFTASHMQQLHEGMIEKQLESIKPRSSRDTMVLIMVFMVLIISIATVYMVFQQTNILQQLQALLHPTVTTPTSTGGTGVPG